MPDSKTDTHATSVINWLRGTAFPPDSPAIHMALYTVAPGEAGGGTEVTGGAYARITGWAFDVPSGSGPVVTANTGAITWLPATANWGLVAGFAILDALTAGNMLYFGSVGVSKSVLTDDTAEISAGDFDLTED